MPAQMIPTPWIRAYDPAQEFLAGHAQGVRIGEANARIAQASKALQQQQQHAAMQAELEKQRIDQNARMESQRIEISKAYQDAQVGMQQQRLQETKKVNDWKIQEVARKAQVQLQASQRIAAGENEMDVYRDLGPQLGFTGSGMAAIARARQAAIPPELHVQKKEGKTFYQSGQSHWMQSQELRQQPQGILTQKDRAQIAKNKDDIKMYQAQLPDSMRQAIGKTEEELARMDKDDPEYAATYRANREEGLKIQAKIDALNKNSQEILGARKESSKPLPAPPVDKREAGQTYMTPKGPHTWTGNGWMAPTPDEEEEAAQQEEEPQEPDEE